jgi:hypothetical protein
VSWAVVNITNLRSTKMAGRKVGADTESVDWRPTTVWQHRTWKAECVNLVP